MIFLFRSASLFPPGTPKGRGATAARSQLFFTEGHPIPCRTASFLPALGDSCEYQPESSAPRRPSPRHRVPRSLPDPLGGGIFLRKQVRGGRSEAASSLSPGCHSSRQEPRWDTLPSSILAAHSSALEEPRPGDTRSIPQRAGSGVQQRAAGPKLQYLHLHKAKMGFWTVGLESRPQR